MSDDNTSNNTDVSSGLINLFEEIYLNYPRTIEDIDFIIGQYISIMEESTELTQDEKLAIYAAFSVASYSPRLWVERIN